MGILYLEGSFLVKLLTAAKSVILNVVMGNRMHGWADE